MIRNALFFALMAATTPVVAADRTGIEMQHPWACLIGVGQDMVAVFGTLTSVPGDVLTGVSSPAARHAGLYIRLGKAGQVSLSRVESGFTLAPGEPLVMSPFGTQIRLTGLTRTFAVGDSFVLSLAFARAGTISVTIPVEPSTATQASH